MDLKFQSSSLELYNKYKEEMVHGFNGDEGEDWMVANLTVFLVTNTCMF